MLINAQVAYAPPLAAAVGILAQTPEPTKQPLPFSHRLHVAQWLKCKDCHVNPDPGEQMTFPATAKCMTCHTEVATDKAAITVAAWPSFRPPKRSAYLPA